MVTMVIATSISIGIMAFLPPYAVVDHLRPDGKGVTRVEAGCLFVLGIAGVMAVRSYSALLRALRDAGIERKGPPPQAVTDWRWEYVFFLLLAVLT